MNTIWIALGFSFIAAFADVLGGALTVIRRLKQSQLYLVTALGTGFLLGATLLDRLPDALQSLPVRGPVYMVIGYLVIFAMDQLQKGSHAHAHPGHDERPTSTAGDGAATSAESTVKMSQSSGIAAFVALLVHTFMDGVIIAGAFTMNRAAGVLMFVAITLHKIPEGFSMATISLATSDSRRRAFASSAFLALSTMIGASLTVWFGAFDAPLVKIVMALATGTFLYISTTSLMPMVRDARSPRAALLVCLGVAIFYVSLRLIVHAGLR